MNEAIKNLRNKEYNPCGELTGRERALCDEVAQNFFNLPYVEVMRAISVKAIAELEHATNFRNEDALKNWSTYNLNEVEQRANLNFETFTALQAGVCKYLVHVLYENRYNIHYNALANYLRTLDEKIFRADMSGEELERRVNGLAQEANYFSTVNDLIGGLWKFLAA